MNDTANGLLEILGIGIGFTGVMLLLSMVVTALVQMTQAVLRIRGRNLQRALEALMRGAGIAGEPDQGEASEQPLAPAPNEKALGLSDTQWAVKVMDSDVLVHVDGSGNALLGRTRTWIEADELAEALEGHVPAKKIERAKHLFSRMEKSSTKRFTNMMALWSVAWAVVVAIVFQVNSFSLLQRLSTDPVYRERAAASATALLEDSDERILRQTEDMDFSAEALAQLAQEYPVAAAHLEEASGVGITRQDLLAELDLVLPADAPDRAAIFERYEELLDAGLTSQLAAARGDAQFATSRLALLDIQPWGQGLPFYFEGWWPKVGNIASVLVTAALLSLGGPFWFNVLRNLASLRDVLAGKRQTSQQGT